MNQIGYLQDMANKYGDFKIAIAYKNKEGEHIWSKHRSVLACWEDFEGKGAWFLANTNNRQILPCEIVIDFDDNPTIEKFNAACDRIESYHYSYKGYHTGSRGYHIHIFHNEFAFLSKRMREIIRDDMITEFGADHAKKNEVMIALEDAPHWKTGKQKTLLRSKQ